jgi:ATP-dependent protease ClpP protease subunit
MYSMGLGAQMGWRWVWSVGVLLSLLDPLKAAEITELPGEHPRVIAIKGELQVGDDEKFIQAALPVKQAVVLFNSEGGNLVAGIEIGKAIKLKQFYTLVAKDTYCASACALAWLAGTRRFMESGARVGFHAAYEVENGQPKSSGRANALVGAYLNQLGLNTEAIIYISTPAPESMQWLTAEDANQYGIDVELIKETVAQPDATPTEAKWLVKDGIDLFGFDLWDKPIAVTAAADCEARCQKEPGCRAYTFNKRNSACFLKTSAEVMYRNLGALSGFEAALENGLKQSPFVIEESTDYAGGDFQELGKTTFGECLQACEGHPGCMAFSYVGRRKQCWLKSQAGRPMAKRGVTSGIKETAE